MTTPVSIKTYRDILKEFQGHIAKLFGTRYVLNGHEPKHNPMAWRFGDGSVDSESRGVTTDLLLIFENRDKATARLNIGRWKERPLYDNIAFAFNADSNDPSGLVVSFSTRTNGVIEGGTRFSGDVFREQLKDINRRFRNDGRPKTRKHLMSILERFVDNPELGIEPFVPDADISLVRDRYESELIAMSEEIAAESDDLKAMNYVRDDILRIVEDKINQSEEAKLIRELEQKIEALKEQVERRQKALFEEYEFAKKDKLIAKKKMTLHHLDRKRRERISAIQLHAPSGYNRAQMRALDQWLRSFNIKPGH